MTLISFSRYRPQPEYELYSTYLFESRSTLLRFSRTASSFVERVPGGRCACRGGPCSKSDNCDSVGTIGCGGGAAGTRFSETEISTRLFPHCGQISAELTSSTLSSSLPQQNSQPFSSLETEPTALAVRMSAPEGEAPWLQNLRSFVMAANKMAYFLTATAVLIAVSISRAHWRTMLS